MATSWALSELQQERIAERLRELGAVLPCPRCGGASFSLISDVNLVPVIPVVGGIRTASRALPAALLMCNQCGFLSSHALIALGLAEDITDTPQSEADNE